eukprot:175139-Rhodomonas_salina.1
MSVSARCRLRAHGLGLGAEGSRFEGSGLTNTHVGVAGFVIDTGRVKEERYDPQRRMAALDDVLVSKSRYPLYCSSMLSYCSSICCRTALAYAV